MGQFFSSRNTNIFVQNIENANKRDKGNETLTGRILHIYGPESEIISCIRDSIWLNRFLCRDGLAGSMFDELALLCRLRHESFFYSQYLCTVTIKGIYQMEALL